LVVLWATIGAMGVRWPDGALVELPRRLPRDGEARPNHAEGQVFGITHLADMSMQFAVWHQHRFHRLAINR
jgi:hypothetical protein